MDPNEIDPNEDEYMLPMGDSVRENQNRLLREYNQLRGERRQGRTRNATRVFETFATWVFSLKYGGFVEDRRDTAEEPFRTRKWKEVTKDSFPPNQELMVAPIKPSAYPPFGIEIMSDTGLTLLKASEEWIKVLNLPHNCMIMIDTAVEGMTLILGKMKRELQTSQLVPFVQTIVENFVDVLPTTMVNGEKVLNVNTTHPWLLVECYSQVIKSLDLRVVKLGKAWLRMRTRRTMFENLQSLAQLVSLLPIEVCDLLRFNVAEMLYQIKELTHLSYVNFESANLDEMEKDNIKHNYPDDQTIEAYLNFINQTQAKTTTRRVELTDDDITLVGRALNNMEDERECINNMRRNNADSLRVHMAEVDRALDFDTYYPVKNTMTLEEGFALFANDAQDDMQVDGPPSNDSALPNAIATEDTSQEEGTTQEEASQEG